MRFLIILLILAGGGWFWHSRSEKQKALESLEVDVKNAESFLVEKQRRIDALQKQLEPLRQGEAELKKPDGSPEQLEKDVLALRDALTAGAAKLDSAEDDYFAAVTERRDFAKTKTFPVLKLPSGEELKECKIARFGEGYISISHADGIVKLQSEDLPEGWNAKYAVDYVSRESKEENAALSDKVQEAVLTPLDLKKARVEEIDERLKQVNEQLLALSGGIRTATRQADKMVRDAYRISLEGGRAGSGAFRRETMFKKAKEMEAAREVTRQKYLLLRKQKADLERLRLDVKKAPVHPGPPPPP